MKLAALLYAASITLAIGCGDNLQAPFDGTDGNDAIDAPSSSDDGSLVDATLSVDAAGPADAALTADGGLFGDGGVSLACSIQELTPVFTCAQTACASDPTLTCVLTNCGILLFALSPSCQQCVITGLTSGDLATTVAACVAGVPAP